MTMTYRYFPAIILLVLVPFLAGCGGSTKLKTNRVEGTIEYQGAPLAGATVTFYPVGGGSVPAFGKTDENGKYKLQTAQGEVDAGTTPGEYTVTVTKKESVPTGKKLKGGGSDGEPEYEYPEMTLKDTLPAQYATVDKTPFKATVEATKLNTFDFKLE